MSDLFVINALSSPRPTLETYRYAMPGEANVPQPQIELFDVASKARVTVKAERFVDQQLQIMASPGTAIDREKDKMEPQWAADGSDKLYFTRNSRDLHKFDLCLADARTGDVKTVIEERLNVYIETRPVRTISMTPYGRSTSSRLSILSSVPVVSITSDSGLTSMMRAR